MAIQKPRVAMVISDCTHRKTPVGLSADLLPLEEHISQGDEEEQRGNETPELRPRQNQTLRRGQQRAQRGRLRTQDHGLKDRVAPTFEEVVA